MREVCYAFSATAKFLVEDGEDPLNKLDSLVGNVTSVHLDLHNPIPVPEGSTEVQVQRIVIEALMANPPLASDQLAR